MDDGIIPIDQLAHIVLMRLKLKVLDQITFFDQTTYLNFFEILVPIDG